MELSLDPEQPPVASVLVNFEPLETDRTDAESVHSCTTFGTMLTGGSARGASKESRVVLQGATAGGDGESACSATDVQSLCTLEERCTMEEAQVDSNRDEGEKDRSAVKLQSAR